MRRPGRNHRLELLGADLDCGKFDAPSMSATAIRTAAVRVQPAMTEPPNNLRESLVVEPACRFGMDLADAVGAMLARQHAVDFFKRGTLRGLLP